MFQGGEPRILAPGRPPVSIGRSWENDIVLEGMGVSRHHARLSWEQGQAILEDLGSRNGTLLNGRRVAGRLPVKPGDELCVGTELGSVQAWTEPEAVVSSGDDGVRTSMHLAWHGDMAELRSRLGVRDETVETVRSSGDEGWNQGQALALVHDLGVALLGGRPLADVAGTFLERLGTLLECRRGGLLVQRLEGRREGEEQGAPPWDVLARWPGEKGLPTLPGAVLEAALRGREAMLFQDPMGDARLDVTRSLMALPSGPLLLLPLEQEGEGLGLLYFLGWPGSQGLREERMPLLAALAQLLGARLRAERLSRELEHWREVERELKLARRIQQGLLPQGPPPLEGYAWLGRHLPCGQVSGDLFGHWPGPDGKLWLSVADVCGKGLGAGLLMSGFQAYVQAWCESCAQPLLMARRLARGLARITEGKRFVTAFLGLLEPETGRLVYTNAGHNPALVCRRGGTVEYLESTGLPLGLPQGLGNGNAYEDRSLVLEPGDLLVAYTDGITETWSPEEEDYGTARLESLALDHLQAPLEAFAEALFTALDVHSAGAPPRDDRTLLLLRREGEGAPAQEDEAD